jgi:hypothetical protein
VPYASFYSNEPFANFIGIAVSPSFDANVEVLGYGIAERWLA